MTSPAPRAHRERLAGLLLLGISLVLLVSSVTWFPPRRPRLVVTSTTPFAPRAP